MSGNSIIDDQLRSIRGSLDKIDANLKQCKIKYKKKADIDLLYNSFTNVLINENFNEADLLDRIVSIENNLKRENSYTDLVKRQIDELKDRLKGINIEVKSIKTTLEKCLNTWNKYTESYEQVDKWLNEKEHKTTLDKDDLDQYLHHQRLHVTINETTNFLIQVSDKDIGDNLKEKLLFINRKWKQFQEKFKDSDNQNFPKYVEFEKGCNNVRDWLTRIDNLINKHCKCTINTAIKYQEELNKAFSDVESIDANMKLLGKLASRLENDTNLNPQHLIEDMKLYEEKLNNFRRTMPEYLTNLTKLCTFLTNIDDCIEQTEHWINEGESVLNSQPDQLNFEQISKCIDRQKKHFQDFNHYYDLINEKIESINSFKLLIPPNFDFTDIKHKVERTRDNLNNLNQKCVKWEAAFKKHQSLWKTFYLETKQLEEWIYKAQAIVSEVNDDINYLIQKHRQFFDNVDNEILHGVLNAGQDLLYIKNEEDKVEIKTLMDTLEGKWLMILSHAPIRLLKLNFKRLESLLRHEINAANVEIQEEYIALNQNQDVTEILRRHEAKFKYSDFYSTCESYLQGLRSCTKALVEQKVEDKSNIEDVLDHLQKYWDNLTDKINSMNVKLKSLPDTKEKFDKNLHQVNAWLTEFEQNRRQLNNNELSTSEYKRILDKIKGSLNDIEEKRSTIDELRTQYDYLNTELAVDQTYTNQLNKTKEKFDSILKSIQPVQDRADSLEISLHIAQTSDSISNQIRNLTTNNTRKFLSEEEECSIQVAIDEQKTVINKMNQYQQEINDLNKQFKICAKTPNKLPSIIIEKLTTAQELLKQSIQEESDRMNSLLQIQQTIEEKKSKLSTITANIQQIESILDKQKDDPRKSATPTSDESGSNKRPRSVQDEKISDDTDGSEYVKRLEMCKNLLSYSKQLVNDLKLPMIGGKGTVAAGASTSRTPTPSQHDYHELREIEIKLENYESEIDDKLKEIEETVSKHKKLKQHIDEIDTRVKQLKEQQQIAESNLNNLIADDDDLSTLDDKFDKTKSEYKKLMDITKELIKLDDENRLKQEQLQLTGITSHPSQHIIRTNNELNERIAKVKAELKQIDVEYASKLNELREKIDEKKTNEQQKGYDKILDSISISLSGKLDDRKRQKPDSLLNNVQLETTMDSAKSSLVLDTQRTKADTIDETDFQQLEIEITHDGVSPRDDGKHSSDASYDKTRSFIRNDGSFFFDFNRSSNNEMPLDGDDLQLGNETDDILIGDDNKNMYEDDFDEVVVDYVVSSSKDSTKQPIIKLIDDEEKIYNLEQMERQQRENDLKREQERLEMERIEKQREEEARLKKIEQELDEQRKLIQLERQKQLKLEEDRRKQDEEEKSRLLKIQKDLDEKRLKQEKEEREKRERLERELDERRMEHEREENERKKKLEKEENERKQRLEREFEEKRKKQEEEERERLKRAERELEEKRLRLEQEEKDKRKNFEMEMQRQMVEKEKEKMKQLELELEERRLRIEQEEKERKQRLEKELEEKRKRQEEEERRRLKQLEEEEERRKENMRRDEEARRKKDLEDEERRRKIMMEEEEMIRRIENEKKELLRRLEQEEEERRKRLEEERQEELRRKQQAEEVKRLEEAKRLEEYRKQLEEEAQEKRKELEKIERERLEAIERRELELKKEIEQKEEEMKRHLEKERRLEEERKQRLEEEERERLHRLKLEEERIKQELEREEEERRKKKELEAERERSKREEKSKIDNKVKNICDNLNDLKLKLNDVSKNTGVVKTLDEQMLIIAESERELNHLNAQLEYINEEYKQQASVSTIGIGESLTQFDLVKSFVQFLHTQIDDKQKEITQKQNAKSKLDELNYNLQQYSALANKILDEQNTNNNYVQNLSDLHEKIKSVHMIEDSLSKCIAEIIEIENTYQFHDNDKINVDLNRIKEQTLRPLNMYGMNLEQIEGQWKLLDVDYTTLKQFLKQDIEYENVLNNKDSIIIEDVGYELRKYTKIKQALSNKLPKIKETLGTASQLFNTKICSPKLNKEMNEVKDTINDVLQITESKLIYLNLINKNNEKIETLDENLNKIKNEFYAIEVTDNEANLKDNIQKLVDLKKKLKQVQNDKEKVENEFEIEVNTNAAMQNLNDLNQYKQKFQANMKQFSDTTNNLNKQIELLETKYQKELLKILPSRNAITELSSWINEKTVYIKQLANSIQPQYSTIHELDNYMRQLQDLNDEVKQKERTMDFIRESIETEIKQGFYDLNVCEHSRVLEQDWLSLKQQIQADLERLDVVFQKVNEFNKDIYEVESWIIEQNEKQQLEDDILASNENIINTNKQDDLLTQISTNKMILDRIEQMNKYDAERKHDIDNATTLKYTPIAENYIDKKLEDLKINLINLEKFSNLRRENSLAKVKQMYASSIHDIIANIKREVNFINHGKLLTLNQYENAIENIHALQQQLDGLYEEMLNTIRGIEQKENRAVEVTDSYLNDYLNEFNYNETKKVLKEVTDHASYDVLPAWKKFNELAIQIDEQFNQTHSNILQANMHLQNQTVSSTGGETKSGENEVVAVQPSSNFEEFVRNIDLKTQLDLISNLDKHAKQLIEGVTNLNTKQQLVQHMDFIHEQHSNLCNLVQNLHHRYEELRHEQEFYEDLIDKTKQYLKEANVVIDITPDEMKNYDSNKIKSLLNVIRDSEVSIRNNMEKFKKLNIQDGERMQNLCDLISSSDETIKNLYLKQNQLLDVINENRYRIQAKLNEIKAYIDLYENRRNEFKSADLYKTKLSLKSHLDILNYMQDNRQKMHDYQAVLDDLLHVKLTKTDDMDIYLDSQDESELKKLMEKLNYLIKQIDVARNNGFMENMIELNEIIEKFDQICSLITDENEQKSVQIKLLYSRFTELKRIIMYNIENFNDLSVPFIDKVDMQHIIDKIENEFNHVLKDTESILDKLHKYRTLSLRIDQELIDIEEKLNKREASLSLSSHNLSGSNLYLNITESDNLEAQFNYFSQLKKYLSDEQFKIDLDQMHKLGCELERQRKYGNILNTSANMTLLAGGKVDKTIAMANLNMDLLKTIDYLPNHEALRIKYLDLTYRIDIKMKELESEFTNWKFIAKKSRRLLDLIKTYHQMLSNITRNTKSYINDSHQSLDDEPHHGHETDTKYYAKTDINRILNALKRDILAKLYDYEYLKDEIVKLSSKSTVKSHSIKDIVDKIIHEWDLLMERVKRKIIKIEQLNNKLSDLDTNLYNLRQEIFVVEIFLNNDCYSDISLSNYKEILIKKTELEELLARLYDQDASVMKLFKFCALNARNHKLILALHERWERIKYTVKEKTLELQNIWLHICDLNEQIEKFHQILTKTNNFFINTLLTMTDNNLNLMRFIEQLYSTIKDDDKLIKYLNQSYICLIKMTTNFPLFHQHERFKQRIMYLNTKWDDLHNEIAVKIKGTRTRENLFNDYKVTKDAFYLWLNEIDLLITNLEYLSTKELQLKYNEIQELKREINDQTEKLFKSEKYFYKKEPFNSLIERLKDILKRIARLDSFVTASKLYTIPQYTATTTTSSMMYPLINPKMSSMPRSSKTFFRRALPAIH